ncbi:membrane protein [Candidatus Rhodobacter oscarellae]|uniref:Membrane protein n=1 Tax=Candidatus Rhodobacter oscarellae TaxID=1675527 RepID=A0A0J9H4A4_9RHOB|nr:metal-dependent hydrolase [Candidatus Rhodobacter lobularis]KMW60503.1 membrane protein [Candidatus Rhodobacter lobularis]
MIIGHLPSTYLAFRFLTPKSWPRSFVLGGVIGGVVPDIDMLWFFTIGAQQVHHHNYLTHRPALWVGLLIAALLFGWSRGRMPALVIGLALGAVLHVVLDSVAGNIAWAWPLSDHAHPLVVVEATHSHWILSFINHPYFQVEIAVTLIAIAVYLWDRRKTR